MNIAFIPVRGGSKSIPLKNIRLMAGKPLVYWTAKAACGSERIDKVYLATDSSEIQSIAAGFKAGPDADLFRKLEVIGRTAQSASDTASTESAMLEFAEQYDFETIILIQATSPLLSTEDIDRGFDVFAQEAVDSVLSVVRQKRFLWEDDRCGFARPVNYQLPDRPRRQNFDGLLVENGAFYITSKAALVESQNRISGNIKTVEMAQESYFEIDEPDDWQIVEHLMKKKRRESIEQGLLDKAKKIKLFLTDCDGCLTDGGMYYSESGDEGKRFYTRDGMGLRLLQERGILTGIVTGEDAEMVKRRAGKLRLDILETGCQDKWDAIKRICRERGILPEQVFYVGDDLNDLEAVKAAGIGCCPADAVLEVKEAADMVTVAKGGRGAVREAADFICQDRF